MKKWIILFSLVVVFLSAGSHRVQGADLVCLIIDQLSLDELVEIKTTNFDRLQQLGAFGLMNVRTAGHLQSESTYLSAGAGKRCQGSKNSHLGSNLSQGGVLNPGIGELSALNQETGYQGQPGLLGKIARNNGIVLGVLGNTDSLNGPRRTITSLAMDDQGFIPLGDVSKNLLRLAPREPWGFVTDWEEMKKAFADYRDRVDILLIETGDISRIEEYTEWLTAEQLLDKKHAALEGIDSFLGFLLEEIDLQETSLAVIVPTPPAGAEAAGKKLSWLILAGRDYPRGWLSSRATRREGIVTITDLLPTFLKLSGSAGLAGLGYPLESGRDPDSSYYNLQRLNNRISMISNLRPLLIRGFIVLQLGAVLLSIILLIRKKNKYREILKKVCEYLLLILLFTPVNFLIVSAAGLYSIWPILLFLTVLTGFELLLLLRLVKTRLLQVVTITFFLVLLLSFDLWTEFNLQADSVLGYSSIIGARYYGLGNEYMGFYIGGTLIFLTGLLELLNRKRRQAVQGYRLLLPLLFILMVYLIGAANRGANLGGMITALFASGLCYLYFYRNIQNWQKGDKSPFLKVFLVGVLVLGVLIYFDYRELLGRQSHIGRTVERVINREWQEIVNIIFRKLSMNFKLLRWTIWTRVLLAFIIALFFLFKYPVARLRLFLQEYPSLAAGFYGGITGSIITMFVNDSGVVAAATIFFYPILGLLLLILDLDTVRG